MFLITNLKRSVDLVMIDHNAITILCWWRFQFSILFLFTITQWQKSTFLEVYEHLSCSFFSLKQRRCLIQTRILNSKKYKNGQDLCSIPRSCYDRRVSKRLFYHFVTPSVTEMSPINFLFQHQPPRSSCRCHQGQTWCRFRQGRLQVRLNVTNNFGVTNYGRHQKLIIHSWAI